MIKQILIFLFIIACSLLLHCAIVLGCNTNQKISMAESVWGQLAKSQTDPETIEEALARFIAEHMSNAVAHTGISGSLETHKTQVVVDHPAGSIVEDKLDSGAVTENKIGSLAVTSAKIDNLAVINAKIDNLAVTSGKIGSLAVTNAKIDNLAVTEAKIGNLAVTNAKIGSLNADKITAGTLTALDIRTALSNKRVSLNATVGSEQHALSFFNSVGTLRGRLNEISDIMTMYAPYGFRVIGDLLPTSGGGYDIGSTAHKWSNGHFYTSLRVSQNFMVAGFVVIDANRTIQNIADVQQHWKPKTASSYDLGDATYKWRALYADYGLFYNSVSMGNILNVAGNISITGNAFLNLKAMSGATASGLSAQNGSMYYRTDDHVIRVLINSTWKTLSVI